MRFYSAVGEMVRLAALITGSSETAQDLVAAGYERVEVISLPSNRGYAGAVNVGGSLAPCTA